MEGQHFRATAGVWGLQEASRNTVPWQFEFPLKENGGRIFWAGIGDMLFLDIYEQTDNCSWIIGVFAPVLDGMSKHPFNNTLLELDTSY